MPMQVGNNLPFATQFAQGEDSITHFVTDSACRSWKHLVTVLPNLFLELDNFPTGINKAKVP